MEDPSTDPRTRELARGLLRSLGEFQGLVEGVEPEPAFAALEGVMYALPDMLHDTQRWRDETTTTLQYIKKTANLAAERAGQAFSIRHADCPGAGDAFVHGVVENDVLDLECGNDGARWERSPLTPRP